MKVSFTDNEIDKLSEGGSGKYLPFDGRFIVRVTKITYGTAKSTGSQNCMIDVVGLGENEGKEGREYLSLVQQAKWKVGQLMLACGATKEQLKNGFDLGDVVGRAMVLVRKKKGEVAGANGKMRTEYDAYFNPLTPAELDQYPSHDFSEADIPEFGDAQAFPTTEEDSDIKF